MSLRWYVKKAARRGMALGAFGSGALFAGKLVSPGPRVRVLTYHRFGDEAREPFCVSPADFEGWPDFFDATSVIRVLGTLDPPGGILDAEWGDGAPLPE